MEFDFPIENYQGQTRDADEPRSTVVIETTEAELIRSSIMHRRLEPAALKVVLEETYINSTSDLGALDLIARANSISDAKE